ncbi:predicted protein [Mycobacterium tuberculosis 94_M4241A]|nr:predicted protein [Mycobacterium tuberculosis 94_M4241A]
MAAALLVLSGFGAVVADARPGDLLYGLHAMMFNRSRVSDDQIVLSAKANLAKVEQMVCSMGRGRRMRMSWLRSAAPCRPVTDGISRQDLINEVIVLNNKVEARDPDRHAAARLAVQPCGSGFGGKLVDSAGSSRRAADPPDACIGS